MTRMYAERRNDYIVLRPQAPRDEQADMPPIAGILAGALVVLIILEALFR